MTKTYKKRKQKRGGAGFVALSCDHLEAKKCYDDNRDERIKTCDDKERKKYVMYCCDSHTDKQMEEFINALKKDLEERDLEERNKPDQVQVKLNKHLLPKELRDLLPDESGLTRVKSRRRRRRRSSRRRRRRRRPKRGRSAKR